MANEPVQPVSNGVGAASSAPAAGAAAQPASSKPAEPLQTGDDGEKKSGPCGLPKGCTVL